LHQFSDDTDKVPADTAAYTSIIHLDYFFIAIDDQLAVDTDFSKFIDNDSNLFTVIFRKDAIQERCFPCAQIAGDDRYSDRARGL